MHRLASGPHVRLHCNFAAVSASLGLATGIWATPHVGCSVNCFWLSFCTSYFSVPWCVLSAVQSPVFFDFTLSLMSAGWGLAL